MFSIIPGHVATVGKQKTHKKKNRLVKLIEYWSFSALVLAVRSLPLGAARLIAHVIGDLIFFLSRKRRGIATDNLRHAFGHEKSEGEIRDLARRSCRSFVFTFLETIKLRHLLSGPDGAAQVRNKIGKADEFFQTARKHHDISGGCIFVTPHIGNWEALSCMSALAGIPLAIVARPLDNEYLEKTILKTRSAEGQEIIPKTNALFTLRKKLRDGISVGMLPDQSTMKGILIDFFGRRATATPVPAILAINNRRPIVVMAFCRKDKDYEYEGIISTPIYPGTYNDRKAEIRRITELMTHEMEKIIRKHPDQYLWMHNRWKMYSGKKEFLSR